MAAQYHHIFDNPSPQHLTDTKPRQLCFQAPPQVKRKRRVLNIEFLDIARSNRHSSTSPVNAGASWINQLAFRSYQLLKLHFLSNNERVTFGMVHKETTFHARNSSTALVQERRILGHKKTKRQKNKNGLTRSQLMLHFLLS